MKYQFKNNNNFTIQLPDKNGIMKIFPPHKIIVLDEFFKRYVPKYLSVIKIYEDQVNTHIKRSKTKEKTEIKLIKPASVNATINKINMVIHKPNKIKKDYRKLSNNIRPKIVGMKNQMQRQIVGKGTSSRINATNFSKSRLAENSINISNDIGIGILSYNRLESLIPLVESIRKYTDLTKTTIFISDESTDSKVWDWLEDQNDIIAFHNDRKGIAVNSNRLLRCLSRFKYKILLNDDVEILKEGWDKFYFDHMKIHNIHNCCYYQNGIYGATRPDHQNGLIRIHEKPHGAVIAFDNIAFDKVGYLDEKFGLYGYEHVDYCTRINKAIHLENVFYDINGSDNYFIIHNDKSSDENKSHNFSIAKKYYNQVKDDDNRIFIDTSHNSAVDGITYVIPFRNTGRLKCVETVINNVKAQKFPVIQIILAEQDQVKKTKDISCIDNLLVKNWIDNMHFCKAAAFNSGVHLSKYQKIILHDADMIVRSDYTKIINNLLEIHDSVHIGKNVCYIDEKSTEIVTSIGMSDNIESDRIVNYYEGGSLSILKNAYFKIGGFCEDFIGYGNEDTEFYKRMVENTKSFTERSIDLFHLWHDRTDGWYKCHDKNTQLQNKMFKMNQVELIDKLRSYLKNKYGDNWS